MQCGRSSKPGAYIDSEITNRHPFSDPIGIQQSIIGGIASLLTVQPYKTGRETREEQTRAQSERGTLMPGPPARDVRFAPVP